MPRRKKSGEKIEEKVLREAIKAAYRQPRLAFYSPTASCVLNYWRSIVPRFSMSEFLAEVVERDLSKRWPKLYKMAKARMGSKFRSRKIKKRGGSSKD